MDIYGGDPRTERILFLVPSVGRSPSLLGQISGNFRIELTQNPNTWSLKLESKDFSIAFTYRDTAEGLDLMSTTNS